MRFFTAAAVALSALTSLAFAVENTAENPILAPLGGTVVAGQPFVIKWNPTSGNSVSLALRKGSDINNLDTIEAIVSGTPNSGTFSWTPATNLKAGSDYAIEIISGKASNYSPKFSIESNGSGPSSSTTSTSSKSSASSTPSTPSSPSTPSATPTVETTPSSPTPTLINSGSNGTNGTNGTVSTSRRPSGTGIVTNNINSGAQLASPLALIFCIVAGLVYLN